MRHLTLIPSWLRFLMIVLLVLGIFFRFFNLSGKVYWHDETYTSLRISGYTVNEVKQQLFNGQIISQSDFAKFQRPNLEKGFQDTINSLAIEEPQHPPLYYILARLWVETFGYSVAIMRSLSALMSLLVFPGIYWLCRELFIVPLSVPFVAIALIAISPIHLVFAQEAGLDMLWLVTILLSSASLLQAIMWESKTEESNINRYFGWGIYTVSLILSLYTFLLTIFIMIAQGIYVVSVNKFRLNRTVISYLISSIIALITFIPWLRLVIDKFRNFNLLEIQINFVELIQFFLTQLNRIFFDLNFDFRNPVSYLITPIFVILVGYAMYYLYRTTNFKVWFFVVTLIFVPIILLILSDLILGRVYSLSPVNLIPAYLGIQLAVAYLISSQIYNGSLLHRLIWKTVIMLLIICGLISYRVSCQAVTWWNKMVSYSHPKIAKIINKTTQPLIISHDFDRNYGNILALSYLVKPSVKFQLSPDINIPKIPKRYKNIFLLNPAKKWRKSIKSKYHSDSIIIYGDNHYLFWKLVEHKHRRRRNIPIRNKFNSR